MVTLTKLIKMTIEEILKCQDLDTLYQEKVNLTSKIGGLHRSVQLHEGIDQTDYKAELTTSYAIMEALNHKLDELEDIAKQNRDEESRIRYNFMRIAKTVLKNETYEKIRNMSDNPLKEMKVMFKELRKQKME